MGLGALASAGGAQAAPISCPGTADPNDREFTVDTNPNSSCLAFGSGNINGNNDAINQLGFITLDKSDDPTVGIPGFNFTTLTGVGTTSGTFAFTAPAGYTDFVLALKCGQGPTDCPTWAAFRLGATSGSWSITPEQGSALSHANLYGKRATVPEPATLGLLGIGLLAGGLARRKARFLA